MTQPVSRGHDRPDVEIISSTRRQRSPIAALHIGPIHFARQTPTDPMRSIRVLADETLRGLLSGSNPIPTRRKEPVYRSPCVGSG